MRTSSGRMPHAYQICALASATSDDFTGRESMETTATMRSPSSSTAAVVWSRSWTPVDITRRKPPG
ncbi:hypothetical protein [Fervidibacter sacchari]